MAEESTRGITARSVPVAIFGIIATALCVQFFEIIEASGNLLGAHGLPVGAFMVFVPLLALGAGFAALARARFLTRAELLTVFFSILVAAPLASSGFWMMMIGPIGTIPKTAYFEVYDALPDKIWPHSKNILANALAPENEQRLQLRGNVKWELVKYDKLSNTTIPVLENEGQDAESVIRIRVPIVPDGGNFDAGFLPEEPYLLTVLLRPKKLGVDAFYFCRVYFSDKPDFDIEVFATRAPGERNYLYQTGFLRRGMYNLNIPRGTLGPVTIEIGLSGAGRLEVAECEVVSVGALDAIYRGRRLVTESEARALPKPLRHELIVRPDRLMSWAGVKYMLGGFIPWDGWRTPFISWTTFGALIFVAMMCLAAIMRRQWMENERYPMPMTRIPLALLGEEGAGKSPEQGENKDAATASIPFWRNRLVWIGFGLSLFWCLMKGWHAYNTDVPNMNIQIDLSTYLTDPSWGRMWRGEDVRNVTFSMTAILLSLAIFMELNVLFSLALGFFLYRSQLWFVEMTGLSLQQDFPYFRQQQIGAFLVYGLLILVFARKHLFNVAKAIAGRGPLAPDGGARSCRASLATLAACFIGMALWASWNGIPAAGMLVFFVAILLVGLVAMKLRSECGTPMGAFTPVMIVHLIPIAGGMALFGPKGVVFICIASYVIFQYFLFLIPGMQLEMLELGHRFRMPARHILGTLLLGTVGGLLLTGWVHLALGYGVGGDNYTQRWPYMDKGFIMQEYNLALAEANTTLPPEDSAQAAPAAPASSGMQPIHWAYLFGGVVTAILALLRQTFSGFWFHPMGFVVGSTVMMEYAWGSILAAGIIRYITLKIGGAVAVRNKLLPFFVGVFVGAIAAYLVFALISGYLYFYHPSILRKSFGGIF